MSVTRTLRAVGGAVVAGALIIGTGSVASADEVRDNQWPLKAFNAEKVWEESTGKGVTVAVIDNGVNGDHPDLKGNVLPGKRMIGGGGTANQEVVGNHGTAMAAVIAGHGHGPGNSEGVKGLAPDVKVLPIKMYDGDEGTRGKEWDVAESIRYAVDHGASVVNMSVGSYGSSHQERDAIAYALKHDVLLVAASGNSGTGSKQYPAAYPGVLAVGAIDAAANIWEDSNYGPHVKLTAPGVEVHTAGNTTPYGITDGTSAATAYVSAAAALIRSKFPDLTAGQVANRLTKTAGLPAAKKSIDLPDEHYGYGFIRPLRALTENIPAGSKYGPLGVPKEDPSGSAGSQGSPSDDQAGEEQGGISPLLIGLMVGGVLLVVIVAVVVSRSNNRRNGPPPSGPGAWGSQGGAPGYPPQQPGSYQQQHSGPPNQPPGW